jgi:gas vesicle protein
MARFFLGFVIGVLIGAAAVVLSSPRSGSATRRQIGDFVGGALETARQARAAREQELWSEFRARLDNKNSGVRSQESE